MGADFQLDMATLVIARFFSVVVFAVGVTIMTLRLRQRETVLFCLALLTGVLAWVALLAASASGVGLLMMAHVGLITATISLQWAAMGRLVSRPINRLWLVLPSSLTMLVVALLGLDAGDASLLSSAVLCVQLAAATLFIGRFAPRVVRLRTSVLTTIGYILSLVSTLARLLGSVFWPELLLDPLAPVPANVIPFLASYLGTILVTLAWLAALKDRAEVALADLASRDDLTGLGNRRHFRERGIRLWSRWQTQQSALALIVLDVDHFKHVNDRWGHDTGDRVLVGLADVIRQLSPVPDVMARMGGEEFCLVLAGVDARRAHDVSEELRHNFAAQIRLPDGSPVRFSAGVAQARTDDESIQSVYRRADDALYQAKACGRDCAIINFGPAQAA